jgi:hypothetical protein
MISPQCNKTTQSPTHSSPLPTPQWSGSRKKKKKKRKWRKAKEVGRSIKQMFILEVLALVSE